MAVVPLVRLQPLELQPLPAAFLHGLRKHPGPRRARQNEERACGGLLPTLSLLPTGCRLRHMAEDKLPGLSEPLFLFLVEQNPLNEPM